MISTVDHSQEICITFTKVLTPLKDHCTASKKKKYIYRKMKLHFEPASCRTFLCFCFLAEINKENSDL